MSRYSEKYEDSSPGALENVMTGGIASLVYNLLPGGDTYTCEITDNATGETATGQGSSKAEAKADAWSNLKG